MQILKKKYSDQGLSAYNAALDAAKNIDYKDPVKLGLALKLSAFYYEVIGNKDEVADQLKKHFLNQKKHLLVLMKKKMKSKMLYPFSIYQKQILKRGGKLKIKNKNLGFK